MPFDLQSFRKHSTPSLYQILLTSSLSFLALETACLPSQPNISLGVNGSYLLNKQCDHKLNHNKSMAELKTLETKSNESLIYALLGWSRCSQQIQTYENCKKTGTIFQKDPTQCYNQARDLQTCYNTKAMKIEPICLPIYNDLKQCLFQGDSHLLACKEEINELNFCQNSPTEYVQFLRASTPHQRLPKHYDFHKYNAKFDYN